MRIAYSHSFLCRFWFRLQSYKWRKSQSLLGENKKGPRHKVYYFDSHRDDFVIVAEFRHIWSEKYTMFMYFGNDVIGHFMCLFCVRCDMWCFECKLSCFINHLGRMNIIAIGIALYKVYFGFNWSKTLWCQYYWLNGIVESNDVESISTLVLRMKTFF